MSGIVRILLDQHPKLGDLEIVLPDACRHLVLTGPNGSGKTLALAAIAFELSHAQERTVAHLALSRGPTAASEPPTMVNSLSKKEALALLELSGARMFSRGDALPLPDMAVYIEATRRFEARLTSRPPDAVDPGSVGPSSFYDWLRHQYLQRLLARASEDTETAERLETWLESFEEQLREVLGLPSLRVQFSPKNYELQFVENGGGPYFLDALALGHASILAILAEILLRLDTDLWLRAPADITGLVLIDEPEMHLHPELEERIMPFLTSAFPGIQFIVATHSPAVAANTPDAFVYDLARREGTPSSDLRGIDYGDLAVGHFGIDTPFDLQTSQQLRALEQLAADDQRSSDA